jgi:hypothetical protein
MMLADAAILTADGIVVSQNVASLLRHGTPVGCRPTGPAQACHVTGGA